MANVNEGHRARMRERIKKEGLQGFQDHEVLEVLLFQYIPRRDTNKIAHDLLNKFGSLSNVFDASPEQLQTVKGISEATACNLVILKEVWLRYKASSAHKQPLSRLSSIIEFAEELVKDCTTEKLVVAFVDNATNFLVAEEYSSKSSQEVWLDLKKVIVSAMRANAAGAVFFHCHVKGVCMPSAADVSFTERMYVTLANLNIMLLDHLIFNSTEDYFSFYQSGVMDAITQRYKASMGIK